MKLPDIGITGLDNVSRSDLAAWVLQQIDEVKALRDEVDQQRTRAEAAESELRTARDVIATMEDIDRIRDATQADLEAIIAAQRGTIKALESTIESHERMAVNMAPTLEILAIQTEQIVHQLNAIIGHVAAHGSVENISANLQGLASLALLRAQRSATDAYGALIAAARKPLNPNSAEAAQEAVNRG